MNVLTIVAEVLEAVAWEQRERGLGDDGPPAAGEAAVARVLDRVASQLRERAARLEGLRAPGPLIPGPTSGATLGGLATVSYGATRPGSAPTRCLCCGVLLGDPGAGDRPWRAPRG